MPRQKRKPTQASNTDQAEAGKRPRKQAGYYTSLLGRETSGVKSRKKEDANTTSGPQHRPAVTPPPPPPPPLSEDANTTSGPQHRPAVTPPPPPPPPLSEDANTTSGPQHRPAVTPPPPSPPPPPPLSSPPPPLRQQQRRTAAHCCTPPRSPGSTTPPTRPRQSPRRRQQQQQNHLSQRRSTVTKKTSTCDESQTLPADDGTAEPLAAPDGEERDETSQKVTAVVTDHSNPPPSSSSLIPSSPLAAPSQRLHGNGALLPRQWEEGAEVREDEGGMTITGSMEQVLEVLQTLTQMKKKKEKGTSDPAAGETLYRPREATDNNKDRGGDEAAVASPDRGASMMKMMMTWQDLMALTLSEEEGSGQKDSSLKTECVTDGGGAHQERSALEQCSVRGLDRSPTHNSAVSVEDTDMSLQVSALSSEEGKSLIKGSWIKSINPPSPPFGTERAAKTSSIATKILNGLSASVVHFQDDSSQTHHSEAEGFNLHGAQSSRTWMLNSSSLDPAYNKDQHAQFPMSGSNSPNSQTEAHQFPPTQTARRRSCLSDSAAESSQCTQFQIGGQTSSDSATEIQRGTDRQPTSVDPAETQQTDAAFAQARTEALSSSSSFAAATEAEPHSNNDNSNNDNNDNSNGNNSNDNSSNINNDSNSTQDPMSVLLVSCMRCGLCDAPCVDEEGGTRRHLEEAHGSKEWPPFSCAVCCLVFPFKRCLLSHLKTMHWGPNQTCKICGKQFQCHRYLLTHLMRHAGVKKFACPLCGWRFFERHKLKFHLELHKEEAQRQLPYACQLCGKKFANKASWSDHCNTHSGDRPFSCDVCGARFSHRVGLRRHKLTHESVKPFCCQQCGKTFALKPKLEQHMTTHTGLSRHICPHCSKVFTAASSVKRHQAICPEAEGVTGEEGTALCSAHTSSTPTPIQEAPALASGEELVFMCGECRALFGSYAEASQHALSHSAPDPTAPQSTMVLASFDGGKIVDDESDSILKQQMAPASQETDSPVSCSTKSDSFLNQQAPESEGTDSPVSGSTKSDSVLNQQAPESDGTDSSSSSLKLTAGSDDLTASTGTILIQLADVVTKSFGIAATNRTAPPKIATELFRQGTSGREVEDSSSSSSGGATGVSNEAKQTGVSNETDKSGICQQGGDGTSEIPLHNGQVVVIRSASSEMSGESRVWPGVGSGIRGAAVSGAWGGGRRFPGGRGEGVDVEEVEEQTQLAADTLAHLSSM